MNEIRRLYYLYEDDSDFDDMYGDFHEQCYDHMQKVTNTIPLFNTIYYTP